MSSSSNSQSQSDPNVTPAEVSRIFGLVRRGSRGSDDALVHQLNHEIQAIAEREGVSKGGVVVKVRDASNITLLHIAALYGREGVLDYYLEEATFPSDDEKQMRLHLLTCETRSGDGPIHMAARTGQISFMHALKRYCLRLGQAPIINSRGFFGCTPLHFAVRAGHLDLAREICRGRAGPADVNAQNMSGQTPLHLAVLKDNWEMAMGLLMAGADVTLADAGSMTPVAMARARPGSAVDGLFQNRGLLP
ncbi:hypothetical protein SLS62_004992 [Diatrype stigma]|uniref:Uncharacterized protein n=1 Tax=Diatrype stigma TaxID=117547 RepID=A0AAN9USD3_9PEZI